MRIKWNVLKKTVLSCYKTIDTAFTLITIIYAVYSFMISMFKRYERIHGRRKENVPEETKKVSKRNRKV